MLIEVAAQKNDHEQRLAHLEHMLEELRAQTDECIRLTANARVAAQPTKVDAQPTQEVSRSARSTRRARAEKPRGLHTGTRNRR